MNDSLDRRGIRLSILDTRKLEEVAYSLNTKLFYYETIMFI